MNNGEEPTADELLEELQKCNDFLMKLVYICVNTLAKNDVMSIPKETFDNFPKDCELQMDFDEEHKHWVFRAPSPRRKRGIVKPRHRIILPN